MSEADSFRPDPDKLLSVIEETNKKEGEGKLKIFLGMAAGVGKTYAMLKAAQELAARGVDVLVAVAETHGRKETEEVLKGLPILPKKEILHRNVALTEMDIDSALQRHPKVILVDELAHTNAPGSRHAKRYLDVLELLKAGIDVYSTVNIQHLESRVDTVREITGIPIKETVPDSIFDQANEVVLIDLAPEELLMRLQEGKVYQGERADTAARNFFRKGNLTALREMALRLAAERVDKELRDFKVLNGIEETWRSGNRLMVSVFASPYAEALIRWTRRLADMIDATWIGVLVDDGRPLSETEKALLSKNLSLIHQLGGEMISTQDTNAVNGIIRVARQNNVTQIIVGRSQRGFFKTLISGGSIVNRLLRQAYDIDVYVVSANRSVKTEFERLRKPIDFSLPWYESGIVLTIIILSWFLAAILRPFIGYMAVGILFLLAVNISAVFVTRISSFALALIFSFIHTYFFIPPVYSFAIPSPEDLLILAMFVIAAAVTSGLTSRLANKEKILNSRQNRTLALYGLSKELAFARSVGDVTKAGLFQFQKVFEEDVALLLPNNNAPGAELRLTPGSTFFLDDKEMAVATWVYSNGRPAGRFTDTLAASIGSYFPLSGREGTVGVLAIKIEKQENLDPDRMALVETFSRQIATGLEREYYHEHSLKESHLI